MMSSISSKDLQSQAETKVTEISTYDLSEPSKRTLVAQEEEEYDSEYEMIFDDNFEDASYTDVRYSAQLPEEDHKKKYVLHRDAQRAAERRKANKGKLKEEAKKAAAKAAEASAPYVKAGVNYLASKINEFVDKVAVLASDDGGGAGGKAVGSAKEPPWAGDEAS